MIPFTEKPGHRGSCRMIAWHTVAGEEFFDFRGAYGGEGTGTGSDTDKVDEDERTFPISSWEDLAGADLVRLSYRTPGGRDEWADYWFNVRG